MATPAGATVQEQELLRAAREGDERAFQRLLETYRGELHAHCYRMLGSVHDADDALQEASLRAWKALPRFEGRSSLRSWLYTIATNTSLNLIAKRPKRVLPLDYAGSTDSHEGLGLPVIESVWAEPYPDQIVGLEDGLAGPEATIEQRESVELAFIAALQHLPANQRAALILREVLGFSAAEVAESLETSVQSVNSALQRARKTVDEKLPDQSQQATLRTLEDDELKGVVEAYMEAMQSHDIDRVVSMLSEDAAWSMPPLTAWFRGEEALRNFLSNGPLTGEYKWRHVPTRANGQPAVGSYTWHDDHDAYIPFALDVFTLDADGRKIREVTSFLIRETESTDPAYYQRWPVQPVDAERVGAWFERFGLPPRLD